MCTNQRCFAIRALLQSFASDFVICSQFWEMAIHFINFIPWIYSQQKAGNFPVFRLSAPPFRIIVKQLESKDKANCVYRQPGLRVLESFIDHGESKTFTGHDRIRGRVLARARRVLQVRNVQDITDWKAVSSSSKEEQDFLFHRLRQKLLDLVIRKVCF